MRMKIRFPDSTALSGAERASPPGVHVLVSNQKRRVLGVEPGRASSLGSRLVTADIAQPPYLLRTTEDSWEQAARFFEREFGGSAVEDFRYDWERGEIFDPERFLGEERQEASLWDVTRLTRAHEVWAENAQGQGVAIAIVDTGVHGGRPEFPLWKRVGGWAPGGHSPWTDWLGHGTMCACIAAGFGKQGGAFDGTAPLAGVISCRTEFYDTELTAAYDYLIERATDSDPEKRLRIVASNSFGLKTGSPPAPPESDFPAALADALAAGVIAVFSAGNNHDLAGGLPQDSFPNSIWLYKCRRDVLTVAATKLDGSMWYYSSRGPGQFVADPGDKAGTAYLQGAEPGVKPDVAAPTPVNGQVVYLDSVRVLPDGWGTSGACPQVAGLAALLLSKNPNLTPGQVREAIRTTAVPSGWGVNSEGQGRIDCMAAFESV